MTGGNGMDSTATGSARDVIHRSAGGTLPESRRSSGAVSFQAGLAAEAAVARHYEGFGKPIAARRWRSEAGEIDLIARDGAEVIFIEVKQSRSHAEAALRLTERQMARIYASASLFLAGEPAGQDTAVRFDVALVDGAGRIEVVENAFAA